MDEPLPSKQPRASRSSARDIDEAMKAHRLETVGLIAAGITHDLNNILSPIMVALPILREWAPDDEGRKIVDMVEQNMNRGATLVHQLAEYARSSAVDHGTVQVGEAVAEVGSFVRATFPRDIVFESDVPPGLPVLRGDAAQIHRVLLNLATNARDAMPCGGTLRISAEVRPAGPAMIGDARRPAPTHQVVISVSDTGHGISPSVLPRIWEPFFSTRENRPGAGLGLSMVRSIIRNHNGFVDVRSQPGQGTRLSVYLPALPATA
jgi:two-component system cell cycle sensor histidine kinase/response regulator CckA